LLSQPDTWQSLKEKLKPGGRIMVNCGGICVEKRDPKSQVDDGTWTWEDGGYAKEATLKSMSQVFPQVNGKFRIRISMRNRSAQVVVKLFWWGV
jgi:hypothetical protein